MNQLYIVIATIVFGFALRSCQTIFLRKTGALVMLISAGLSAYFLTDNLWAGIAALFIWFFLPWVELLTKIRKMRIPLENKLHARGPTNIEIFPSAEQHLITLEKAGYEHIHACGWDLGGMEKTYQLFWNAETKCVAAICLCEQSNVTYAYLTLTSRDLAKGVWRTTNFPFSPILKSIPSVNWNKISCTRECAINLINSHHLYLSKQGFIDDDLCTPDPDHIGEEIEHELQNQINYNIDKGIISRTDDGHARYTIRGLFFLWKQFICDMIRLC